MKTRWRQNPIISKERVALRWQVNSLLHAHYRYHVDHKTPRHEWHVGCIIQFILSEYLHLPTKELEHDYSCEVVEKISPTLLPYF